MPKKKRAKKTKRKPLADTVRVTKHKANLKPLTDLVWVTLRNGTCFLRHIKCQQRARTTTRR
jgi:hypothetical protein